MILEALEFVKGGNGCKPSLKSFAVSREYYTIQPIDILLPTLEVRMSSSSLRTTLQGYVKYRGREGQWSFLLHRITGLGVLLFLAIHILDTATVYFAPSLYDEVIKLYRSTVFGLGEIALVFCLFFHGEIGRASCRERV
jgi:hypothetical protein